MPASKKKNPALKKFLLFLLGTALIIGASIWYFKSRPSSSFVKKSDSVEPSEDQTELISAFGYPDVFMLTMEDATRYEIWTYYDMEKSFVFWNGNFIEDQAVESLSEDFDFPNFRPTQFKNNLTLVEVSKILGDPTHEGEINPKLIENAKVYDFWDQVKVGTKDEKVTYVETLPVFIPEEYRVRNEKEN